MRGRRHHGTMAATAVLIALGIASPGVAGSASTRQGDLSVSANVRISTCGQANAEVEEVTFHNDAYVDWIGCGGIGFARSTDGGRTFSRNLLLPGSQNLDCHPGGCFAQSWDPAIAVSSSGRVYATFMHASGTHRRPVVDVSADNGQTFTSVALPIPTTTDPHGNFGDRDFVTVSSTGIVYVTWDYGPSDSQVQLQCASHGSCSFTNGDFNAVLQKSTDGGQTWTGLRALSPRYPYGGAIAAPIVVQPDGTLDVDFLAMATTGSTHAIGRGYEWFTRSTNGGATWSTPIRIAGSVGSVSPDEWWIDGALSTDQAGDLYVTWDTQGTHDQGWLVDSTDGGTHWSAPLRVATSSTEELVESAGVGRGLAAIGWQTQVPTKGYATFVRPFSIARGWLSPTPLRVSTAYGRTADWPGDTFGIWATTGTVTTHGSPVAMSWGSATPATPTYANIIGAVAAP